ncbi:MAG: ABC transporter permease [Defluviitaleaceae bacterium]|nr:ABC transporter permease [Defluviitaleaceae bacterium]
MSTDKNIEIMDNPETAPSKKRSQLYDIWRRFSKSKTAMLGLFIMVVLILLALTADIIAPGDERRPGYDIQNLQNTFQPPSLEHPFGTDNFGRDIFARVAHGSRISLQVGLVVVSISMFAGVALGAVSGFFSGFVDNFIMRTVDILLAIPNILLAIAIASALRPGLGSVMIAVGISAISGYARIVRASVLSLREQEFIEAARSVGASNFRIITKHILPNCMAPIIVQATMGMASAISVAAALSFIGIGIQPPTPEWGAMLAESRRFIRDHWHMVMFPGVAIALIIFALNMMGDGLRDAFDPRLKK